MEACQTRGLVMLVVFLPLQINSALMLLSGSDIASVVEANIDPPLLVAERAANALGCS